jgi:predicted AAA+ superfamily ATPase
MTYEELDKPLVLFLDETQYDPTWLITLQGIVDRTSQVFVFISGSTALRSTKDLELESRITHEILYPISSPEYIKITKQKFQIPGLGESIRDAILFSENSETLYTALQHIAPEVNTYYKGSLQSDFYKYFCYGSLPHILSSGDESTVYDQIQRTIDRILYKDLPVSRFHPDTVSAIPGMLFELAGMDHCNVKKMAEKFDMSRSKMSEILDALE